MVGRALFGSGRRLGSWWAGLCLVVDGDWGHGGQGFVW